EAVEEPVTETGDEVSEGDEATRDRSTMRYRKQRRGGKGGRDIRTSERNGVVVGVIAGDDDEDIMLITAHGLVDRTHGSEIRVVGRNTQGVRIMNLGEGDRIASIAKIAREEVSASAAPTDEAAGSPAPTETEASPENDGPTDGVASG